jgi:hypothetical protein
MIIGLYCKKIIPSLSLSSNHDLLIVGYLALSVFSGYTSVLLPTNNYILGGLLICIFVHFIFVKKEYFNLAIIREEIKSEKIEIYFLILTLFFLSIIGAKQIYTADSGIYHSQAVRWIRQFPVVPGLGNFQPQLSFNSMFFPVSALFTLDIKNILPGKDLLIYPLNTALFLAVSTRLFSTIKIKFLSSNMTDSLFYMIILFFMFLLFPIHISSLSSDVVSALLIIFCVLIYFEYDWQSNETLIYLFIALSILVVTIKLSSSIFLLTALGMIIYRHKIKILQYSILISLIIILPFLIRNYYLSGYLVCPFPYIDIFSPDWKVPAESVNFEIGVIKAWARNPGSLKTLNMPMSDWLPIWWKGQDLIDKTVIATNIFILLAILRNIIHRNSLRLFINSVILLNICFWFFTAPDFRFAYATLFIGVALVIREGLEMLTFLNINKKILTGICIILIAMVLYFNRWQLFYSPRNTSSLFIPYTYPNPEVEKIKLNFDYFKTINSSRCYNHELPCNTRLTNRNYDIFLRSNDLSSGFRVQAKTNNK